MSQQRKQKQNITNQQLLQRLLRLDVVRRVPVSVFAAYVGLYLCNKGKKLEFSRAIKIIKKKRFDIFIKTNAGIPCENVLEALIYIVIYKRDLVADIVLNEEAEVWNDELAAPIFDIMKTIMEIYKV